MKNKCPECEYHKARAANWRAEAYRLGGHDVIQRAWIGLTDEEIWEMPIPTRIGSTLLYVRRIEAKLKEKNT